MSDQRPELIFVTGPQAGERAVVTADRVVAGRSNVADIHLAEPSVSRKQFSLAPSPDGWVMENLSGQGTWVNGKRYKKGKQILLATGDVIGTGEDTKVLYVSPGDDPEAALTDWRQVHAQGPPAEAPTPPADRPAPEPEEENEQGPRTAPVGGRDRAEAPADSQQDAAKASPSERSRRARKILIGVAIYAVFLGALMVVLSFVAGGDEVESGPMGPPRFSPPVEIARILTENPWEFPPNPVLAQEMLDKARVFFRDRDIRLPNRYLAVKYYKLHLAFQRGEVFDRVEDQTSYITVRDELIDRVQKLYRSAYVAERARDWNDALGRFERLRAMLPVKDMPRPEEDNELFDNLIRHITYVRSNVDQE